MSGRPLERGERLGAALGDDDVGVAALEQRGHREDVAEVVVDDEDLQLRRSRLSSRPLVRGDRGRCARRCGRDGERLGAGIDGAEPRGGGGRQPWPQRREELGGVDRLRDVVVGAGVDAALALAGRRLAGDGDDRQRLRTGRSARIARIVS